mgnify:FL=1
MPFAWWALVGLFVALLINRAADCWLTSARLQCGLTHHPRRRMLVLVALPILFVWLAWQAPGSGEPRVIASFAAILILLAVIDLEQRRVPNVVVLPAVAFALGVAWRDGYLLGAAGGAVLAFAVFLALFALGRRLYGPGALGMGDGKLAGLSGAMVGLAWLPHALVLGILLAGIAAAGLLVSGRAGCGDLLPYGSFMALAAVAILLGVN